MMVIKVRRCSPFEEIIGQCVLDAFDESNQELKDVYLDNPSGQPISATIKLRLQTLDGVPALISTARALASRSTGTSSTGRKTSAKDASAGGLHRRSSQGPSVEAAPRKSERRSSKQLRPAAASDEPALGSATGGALRRASKERQSLGIVSDTRAAQQVAQDPAALTTAGRSSAIPTSSRSEDAGPSERRGSTQHGVSTGVREELASRPAATDREQSKRPPVESAASARSGGQAPTQRSSQVAVSRALEQPAEEPSPRRASTVRQREAAQAAAVVAAAKAHPEGPHGSRRGAPRRDHHQSAISESDGAHESEGGESSAPLSPSDMEGETDRDGEDDADAEEVSAFSEEGAESGSRASDSISASLGRNP